VSRFTFVRAVVRETGTTNEDALFIFHTRDGRVAFDSLIGRGVLRSAP